MVIPSMMIPLLANQDLTPMLVENDYHRLWPCVVPHVRPLTVFDQ